MIALLCTKHKRYKAARHPVSACRACWMLWQLKLRALDNTGLCVITPGDTKRREFLRGVLGR